MGVTRLEKELMRLDEEAGSDAHIGLRENLG